jgi:hypothetical protein
MKLRIGVIAVLLFVSMGFASSALACEKCTLMYDSLVKMCWSGNASGAQWCYGGFGTNCTSGGTCGGSGGGGLGDEVESPDFSMSRTPCLICTGAEPDQGFTLHNDKARPAAVAKK